MWAGLSTTHWGLRLVAVAAGSAYLPIECGPGIGELSFEVILLVVLLVLLIATVTRVVRFFKGTVRRVQEGAEGHREALQVGIRHLMLLTFVVAILTLAAKKLSPMVPGLDILVRVAVLGVCYTSVALTSVWAMLGARRPLLRSILVVLMAGAAGLVGGHAIGGGPNWSFWLTTTGLQAILLVGSLCLVRIMGYRFVATPLPRSDQVARL